MSINIQSILSEIENGIVDLAKTTVKDFAHQAMADGRQFFLIIKDDLVRWTQELADGRITKAEFETLLLGEKDLAEMVGLKQTGLALARIDEFKSGVLNLILNTTLGALKV